MKHVLKIRFDIVCFLNGEFPHTVSLPIIRAALSEEEAEAWCAERFGISARTNQGAVIEIDDERDWARLGPTYYFRNWQNAFEFKMAWR
jgi:hypothetical protein